MPPAIHHLTSQRLAIALLVISLLLFGAGVCFKFSTAQLAATTVAAKAARAHTDSLGNTVLAASLAFMVLRVSLAIVRVISVVVAAANRRNGR